jgi:hypothetical protein
VRSPPATFDDAHAKTTTTRGCAGAARIRQPLPARFFRRDNFSHEKTKLPKSMQRPALRAIGARSFRSSILRPEKTNAPKKASFLGLNAQKRPQHVRFFHSARVFNGAAANKSQVDSQIGLKNRIVEIS